MLSLSFQVVSSDGEPSSLEMSYTHVGPDKNGTVLVDAIVPYNGVKPPLANLTNLPVEDTTPPPTHDRSHEDDSSRILIYVLVPLGSLVLIAVLSFLVSIYHGILCHVLSDLLGW